MGVVISTAVNNSPVDAKRWSDMNFSELLEQKNILINRYEYIVQQENKVYANQILEGIYALESLIQTKCLK